MSAWGVGQQKANLWDLTGGYGSCTAVGSVSVKKSESKIKSHDAVVVFAARGRGGRSRAMQGVMCS